MHKLATIAQCGVASPTRTRQAPGGAAVPGQTPMPSSLMQKSACLPLPPQALGMHDLALAYMVISHSRRDPGEYLVELQRFAAAPEGPLRAHALEAHLGRWPAALRALVAAGEAHADAALTLAKGKVRGERLSGQGRGSGS